MKRNTLLFALTALFVLALSGCHSSDDGLNTMDDVRKASEGKQNIDAGPPPGSISR
jgi:hypothetical protein